MSEQPSSMPPLPRSLTSQETWGFGFSGLLLWLGTAPAMHAALGPQALYVWLPATIIGILLKDGYLPPVFAVLSRRGVLEPSLIFTLGLSLICLGWGDVARVDHLFTTKEVGKGTGLGLAIARSIVVEKHHGSLLVNSTLGKGTEFVITLPILTQT